MTPDPDDVTVYDGPRGLVCVACRKRSDAAKALPCPKGVEPIVLCGTHRDEFLNHVMETPALRTHFLLVRDALALEVDAAVLHEAAVAFAARLREGKFKACWAAEEP